MVLYADDDFRGFVDKLPEGCRITIVSDSCHSGGLLDKTKEQIGDSTRKDDEEEESHSHFGFSSFIKHAATSALESRGINLPIEGTYKSCCFYSMVSFSNSCSNICTVWPELFEKTQNFHRSIFMYDIFIDILCLNFFSKESVIAAIGVIAPQRIWHTIWFVRFGLNVHDAK